MAIVSKAKLVELAKSGKTGHFPMDEHQKNTGRAYIYKVARELGFRWKVISVKGALALVAISGQKPYAEPPPPAPLPLFGRVRAMPFEQMEVFPADMVPSNAQSLARAQGLEIDLLRFDGAVAIVRRNGRL